MDQPLWVPSKERVAQAQITAFAAEAARRYSFSGTGYPELYNWSVSQPSQFWALLWEFCNVIASTQYSAVLKTGATMRDTIWFPGARLNYAENALRYRDNQPALIAKNEAGVTTSLSYKELSEQVAAMQHYLRSCGVGAGDRVAAYIPNISQAVVAMLATASIGAIWSSCSPDFGVAGVLDRFGQIKPTVLFTADGYNYNGKQFDCLDNAKKIAAAISSIKHVVVVPYLAEPKAVSAKTSWPLFDDIVRFSGNTLTFEQLPFDHPLYILYSSGTTGVPKCIVHGAGGTLLQHLKELALHTDVTRKDRICYFTTCGWMMWNWLISSLATGATVLLYDGSPMHPNANTLFDFVDETQMTIFGTSAKYISAIEKAGVKPRSTHPLKSLTTILSTGSPLLPESFDYVYKHIKEDLCLASISGGTDIVSCFALGNPTLPVYRGELQVRGLGMKVEAFDEDGKAVFDKPGELVCSAPFPAMPIYFWNDKNGKKYKQSYFGVYENVWRHGDWIQINKRGGVVIHGRSDATLNPGGVRIGTAEIYRQVEQLDQILESLVVGQQWENDERIILFVRLRPGELLSAELIAQIKSKIRSGASPRHIPAKIFAVPDIPRTRSGKISELAVKNLIHGREAKNTAALANPESLEYFKNLKELGK